MVRTVTVRDLAAEKFGTNRTYFDQAAKIMETRPNLHEQIKSGKLTLPQAVLQMKQEERRHEMEFKAANAAASMPDGPTWEIIEGQCGLVLQTLPQKSARLIFADPPYNICFDYGEDGHDDDMPPEAYYSMCREFIEASVPLLTDDGSLWVLINHEHGWRVEQMMEAVGLTMRNWITWFESFGVNCSRKFNRTSRRLLHAVKDRDHFVFHREAVSRPSDRQVKYNNAQRQSRRESLG